MNLVVAVDKNWAIGKGGQLLIRNGQDLAHFKELTLGNVIVYGRKTLDTFRDRKPLPGRTNLVLTRDPELAVDGATIIHSTDELNQYPSDKLFVCGGASVYKQILSKCKYAYVTHFDTSVEGADAFFPRLDEMPNWRIAESREETSGGLKMTFATWVNDGID